MQASPLPPAALILAYTGVRLLLVLLQSALSFDEAQRLLDAVEGQRWAALYRLAVNLGMREAELFGLTWQAVDFERGTLRIFQQLRRARPKRGEPRTFVLQAVKAKAAATYAHALDESKSDAIAGLSKRLKRRRPHNSQQPENDDGPSSSEGPSAAS